MYNDSGKNGEKIKRKKNEKRKTVANFFSKSANKNKEIQLYELKIIITKGPQPLKKKQLFFKKKIVVVQQF